MEQRIGTLTRVALRKAWAHEAYGFTTWMRSNIAVLGESLGLDLDSAEQEQPAGSFSVDIVAVTGDGRTVVIENQYGRSDHDHLGKLVTYLTSFDADCAVWVVEEARPEHIGAITWLNEASDVDFYLVKAEAIRIDDGPLAPLFTRIVGPTPEGKAIGKEKKELRERHHLRHRFWSSLLPVAKARSNLHASVSPGYQTWIGTSAGISGLWFNYGLTRDGTKAELYIDRGDAELNERIFGHFLAHREAVEQQIGGQVSWQRMEERRACRIAILHDNHGYMAPEADWPALISQVVESMFRLEGALRPYFASVPSK